MKRGPKKGTFRKGSLAFKLNFDSYPMWVNADQKTVQAEAIRQGIRDIRTETFWVVHIKSKSIESITKVTKKGA